MARHAHVGLSRHPHRRTGQLRGALLRTGSFTDPAFVEAGKKLQELIALEPFQDGFLGATYGDMRPPLWATARPPWN